MSEHILFTGGRIWCPATGDLEALVVVDGRIQAVGEDAVLWASAHEHRTVDLAGGFLMPAFGDGHAHPLFGGLEDDGPQVRRCRTVDEIVAEVRAYAAAHPDLPWITGASYDSSLAPEGLFDARWLDEAVHDRPVLLRAWDYHTVWVNSRALELAGITTDTPEPSLGEIPRRADGSPLGTLREWGAIDLAMRAAPPIDRERLIAAVERAGRRYAALGVTWVQDAWVEPDLVEAYCAAAEAGRLPIRFNLALYADPRHWPDQLEAFVEQRAQVERLNHPQLTARTVKFFADGVVENATGALLQPYDSECGSGMLVWDPELLKQAVAAVDAAGFQPHIHTIGDRAARVALDAIDHAETVNGPRERRAVLAHVQLVDSADHERFRRQGTVANAEPLWAQLDDLMTVLTEPRLGPERTAAQYQLATLAALGAPLSFGSDWPVSSANPLEGLSVACSRQTGAREPAGGWTPHERLPATAAFRAYTTGVAHQAFRDAGALIPGYDADLVVLDTDPRTVAEPRDIDGIRVLSTWLAGECVFEGDQP
ncbi:amidohydrolase [Actinomycetota bacterium]